jgi:LuxR family maltose regulon positive regulatory protein
MMNSILATKLHRPAPHPNAIMRPHLLERLQRGAHGKLTLVSAPAGFGKTTLITTWLADEARPVAWLSLEEGDSDPVRFLMYLVVALQNVASDVGADILAMLDVPQPPPIESLMTALLNDITTIDEAFVLVLDDYHVLDHPAIDRAMTFLIDHQPTTMHLVITTREDPPLPLARLRARGVLNELRVVDLRFTHDETSNFMQTSLGIDIAPDDIRALEARTEGWIAGLQLAVLSLQGQTDISTFVASFTGSHHYVLDYLMQEVLHHQSADVQDFLFRTSILNRMCAPLCDALLDDSAPPADEALAHLQRANLFLIPLDYERRWYRYHHLFADLLRIRANQAPDIDIPDLHRRASAWYEQEGLILEAFNHATQANDIDNALRLLESTGTPLYLRGHAQSVLNWVQDLPRTTRDAHPRLWMIYVWTLWITYQSLQAEEKLAQAERALQAQGDATRSTSDVQLLEGHIALMRALLAANQYQTDIMMREAQRAQERLPADDIYLQSILKRTLASAHHLTGRRVEALQAYGEAIALCERTGDIFTNILATTGLGMVQEMDLQLYSAQTSFEHVLALVGQPPQPIACEAYLGLARIAYAHNDLPTAQQYAEEGIALARPIEGIDTALTGDVFLARLQWVQGDIQGATQRLHQLAQTALQSNFTVQQPRIAALLIRIHLEQGDIPTARALMQEHDLPLSQARIALAQGETTQALIYLGDYLNAMTAKQWHDERLKALILQALAYHQADDLDNALVHLQDALKVTQLKRIFRPFLDEGKPMHILLGEATSRGIMPHDTRPLLALFQEQATFRNVTRTGSAQPLIEPLSERELEILALVADGLSNRQISERLYLALSTVKGHNRNIFDKLQVKRRTEAVARARELGLID